MESEDGKGIINYLLFGIHKKYEKRREEIGSKARLERILKSASLDIMEGAETTLFRIVPLLASSVTLYSIRMYNYKLAGKSAMLTALIIFADLGRHLYSKK